MATDSRPRAAIVLAAGKGKRMKSDLPKVLHEIHGRPMIRILLDTLEPLAFDRTVVVIGFKGDLVEKALADYPVDFVWQHEQRGTGHAVMMARERLRDFDGTTLVCAGDVPFLTERSVRDLISVHERTKAAATCLSAIFDDPTGYGRIVRDGDSDFLRAIVEHKDASEEIQRIREINSGTFCFDNRRLFGVIDDIDDRNAQGEYYLTDAVKILHGKGLKVAVVTCREPDEVRGVNSKEQLEALAEKFAPGL
ncbi:MAG: NTP transferase domain-containing protein [candidate division Zixibacteria bacterium]|nr:NTP transferase domain-containing protein [candidate division Zixibacteria bacterium]